MGGNDGVDNLKICDKEKIDHIINIIKRNPRREKPENWLMVAEQHKPVKKYPIFW